jgi:hypothetical protein
MTNGTLLKVQDIRGLVWDLDEAGSLIFEDDHTYATLPEFTGISVSKHWASPRAYFLDGPPADFAFIRPGVFACSGRVLPILNEIVPGEVELLPIEVGDSLYYAMNILNVVDYLDVAATKPNIEAYTRGRLSYWPQIVFNTSLMPDMALFKVPELIDSQIFATRKFVDAVRANNLTGLRLETALHLKFSLTKTDLQTLIEMVYQALESVGQTVCVDLDLTKSDISTNVVHEFMNIARDWHHPSLEAVSVQGDPYAFTTVYL